MRVYWLCGESGVRKGFTIALHQAQRLIESHIDGVKITTIEEGSISNIDLYRCQSNTTHETHTIAFRSVEQSTCSIFVGSNRKRNCSNCGYGVKIQLKHINGIQLTMEDI